jgi:hypothetical protein
MQNVHISDDIINTSPYFWKNLKEIEEKWSSYTKDLDDRNKTILSIILENTNKNAYRMELENKENNNQPSQYFTDLKELLFKDISFNYKHHFSLKNCIGMQPICYPVSLIHCNDKDITLVAMTHSHKNYCEGIFCLEKEIVKSIYKSQHIEKITISTLNKLKYTDVITNTKTIKYFENNKDINIHHIPWWIPLFGDSEEENLKEHENSVILFNNNHSEDKPIVFCPFICFYTKTTDGSKSLLRYELHIAKNVNEFYKVYKIIPL